MEVLNLLDSLLDLVENAKNMPFTNNIIINKDELLDLLEEVKIKMPDDIKQAQWVKEERQKLIMEARREADGMKREAEDKMADLKEEKQKVVTEAQKEIESMKMDAEKKASAMVDESEIMKRANEQARDLLIAAQTEAKKIRIGTRQYADELLADLEKELTDMVMTVKGNRDQLKGKKQ